LIWPLINLGGGKGRNNPGLQMGNQMMYVKRHQLKTNSKEN
jgi:hypothetical protein